MNQTMPREPKQIAQPKRFRLNLELTPRQYEKLSELEEDLGTTKAEIVRDALRLFTYAAELAAAGATFRAIDKDGNATDVVVLELS